MLAGKQKRQLRADGNRLRPSVIIGKEGVTTKVMAFLEESFSKKELVKVRVLESCSLETKHIAGQVTALQNSEVVNILGRTILLYRPQLKDSDTACR